jgi:hypothetical protein
MKTLVELHETDSPSEPLFETSFFKMTTQNYSYIPKRFSSVGQSPSSSLEGNSEGEN